MERRKQKEKSKKKMTLWIDLTHYALASLPVSLYLKAWIWTWYNIRFTKVFVFLYYIENFYIHT